MYSYGAAVKIRPLDTDETPKRTCIDITTKRLVACCLTSEHLIWVIFELLEALLLVRSQSYDCLAPHAQLPLRNCMHTHLKSGQANLCHVVMAAPLSLQSAADA